MRRKTETLGNQNDPRLMTAMPLLLPLAPSWEHHYNEHLDVSARPLDDDRDFIRFTASICQPCMTSIGRKRDKALQGTQPCGIA